MHVNLDLFSDIRKLFFHHDREFDVKTRGNFIIRYCNRNFVFDSNTVLHLRRVWDGFVCSGIYNHSLLLLENFLYFKKKTTYRIEIATFIVIKKFTIRSF